MQTTPQKHKHRAGAHRAPRALAGLLASFGLATATIESRAITVGEANMVSVASHGATVNDGTDDTTAIHNAIVAARNANKALFFPAGTYNISDTITATESPSGNCGSHNGNGTVQLVGQTTGSARPLFKLANNAAGFGNAGSPKPVVRITSPNNSNCRYRDVFRGIDIEVGTGNPGAVGIEFDAAQHSLLEDVKITLNSGYAGVTGVPGRNMAAVNIEVVGGTRGISLDGTSLGCVLVGLKLSDQSGEAIFLRVGRGTAVVGVEIVKSSGTGPAIRLAGDSEERGNISLLDASIDLQTGGTAINNTSGRFVALTNVYVKNATTIVDTGTSADNLGGSTGWTKVTEYTYTPGNISGTTALNLINGTLTNNTVKTTSAVSSAPSDLASRHVWSSTPSFQTSGYIDATAAPYNATEDDSSDDTAAIQAALDSSTNAKVFLPAGRYIISAPLVLGANDSLIGVPGYRSTLVRAAGWAPTTAANRTWMIDTANSTSGTALLQDLGLDNDDVSVVGGVRWRVGRNSLVRGVRTYMSAGRSEAYPAHIYEVTGGGGGRWYSLSDHANSTAAVSPEFRKVYVGGTSEPLTFYGFNLEHGGTTSGGTQYAFAEIKDAANVRWFGIKSESDGVAILIENSTNVFGSMSFANSDAGITGPLIDIIGTGSTPLLLHGVNWPGNSGELVRDDFSGDQINRGQFLGTYKRGTFNHGIWEPAAGNTPPTVAITEPTNGASFPALATTVSATASDPDGVSTVFFDANGSPIGQTTIAPYSVTWSPTAAGTYSLTADASDTLNAVGSSAPVSVTITNSVPSITTTSLPGGTVGVAYNQSLAATGGDGTTKVWELVSGALPANLLLSAGGVISGNPTTAGTATFTVGVADGDLITDPSDEDTQALSITISGGGGGGDVTINRTVGASTDDDETTGGIVSTDLELGNTFVGVRFTNITIPQGKTIVSAKLTFTRESSGATTNAASVTVFGEDRNNAATFVNGSSEPFDRTKTTASVGWSIASGGAAGATRVSPELKTIVQEIVNRVGWASGNAMVFLIRNDSGRWDAASWDDSATAPQLEITYTP